MSSRIAEHASGDWRDALAPGLRALNLAVSGARQAQLLTYVELLLKWNRTYNLTATSTAYDTLVYHLFDSLSVAPFLRGRRVLDIGTGAGLPGIPLALVCPELHFTLLDSNGKKIRFVKQALLSLRMANVTLVRERAEDYREQTRFDTVLCRAFSKLKEFVHLADALCAPTGKLLAMKGVYPNEELQQVPTHFRACNIHVVNVPGLDAQRHVVELARAGR